MIQRRLFISFILLILLGISAWSCSGKNYTTFNIPSYERSSERTATLYFESVDLDALRSFAFRNVAIVEFTVEYLVDLPDATYPKLTDELYDLFVEYLEEVTGLRVISKEKIQNSPIYMHLRKRDIFERWEEPRGLFRKTYKRNHRISVSYPASHLGILIDPRQDPTFHSIRSTDNEWYEPGVLFDVGADAAMKVHTIIDFEQIGKKGRLIITGLEEPPVDSKIEVLIGYSKTPAPAMGIPSKDGRNYIYRYNDKAVFRLKRPLVSYETIRSNRNVFNLEEFAFRTQEMFSVYADMFSRYLAKHI